MILLPKKNKHSFIYNIISAIYKEDLDETVHNSIKKIINYYNNLDYSMLTKKEYNYFRNAIINQPLLSSNTIYTIINCRKRKACIIEEKREIHIPLFFKKANIQRAIYFLITSWLIERISYAMDISAYPYEKPEFIDYDYLNLTRYIKIRQTFNLFYKLGIINEDLNKSNIYDEFREIANSSKTNTIVDVAIILAKQEKNNFIYYTNAITNAIEKE